MSEWKEDLHPRGHGGKFGSGTWVGKLNDKIAHDIGETKLPGEMGRLPHDQQQAVYDYSAHAYGLINSHLRGNMKGAEELDHEDFKELDKMAAKIDAAVASSKLSRDAILYRGVGDDRSSFNGPTFSDRGFSSTSTDPHQASSLGGHKGVLLKIEMKEGQTGLSVGGPEGEVILPRNTKFVVKSRETVNGRKVITVTVAEPVHSKAVAATVAKPKPKAGSAISKPTIEQINVGDHITMKGGRKVLVTGKTERSVNVTYEHDGRTHNATGVYRSDIVKLHPKAK